MCTSNLPPLHNRMGSESSRIGAHHVHIGALVFRTNCWTEVNVSSLHKTEKVKIGVSYFVNYELNII